MTQLRNRYLQLSGLLSQVRVAVSLTEPPPTSVVYSPTYLGTYYQQIGYMWCPRDPKDALGTKGLRICMQKGCYAATSNPDTYIVNNIAAIIADQIAIHHNLSTHLDTYLIVHLFKYLPIQLQGYLQFEAIR